MTIWYIAPSTVTTTGVGTRENPFKCNAINWASILPGDTIYLRTALGNYNETLTIGESGTAGNYITIDSDPLDGGKAIIDAQSTRQNCISPGSYTYILIRNVKCYNANLNSNSIGIVPKSNWKIYDCYFENCFYTIAALSITNITVEGLESVGCTNNICIYNVTGTAIVKNLTATASDLYPNKPNRFYIDTVSNLCTLNVDGVKITGGGYAYGSDSPALFLIKKGLFNAGSYIKNIELSNGNQTGLTSSYCHGNLSISKIKSHDNGRDGIRILNADSYGITISDALLYNNHGDGLGFEHGSHDCVSQRILSYNNGIDPMADPVNSGDGFTSHDTCYNLQFLYCAAVRNRNSGFAMVVNSAGDIYQCTSAYNGDSLKPTVRAGFYFSLAGVNATSGKSWTVKNSISYKDYPRNIWLSAAGKTIVTFDYNSYKELDTSKFATIDGGLTNISWISYHEMYEANSKNEDGKVNLIGMIAYDSPCVDAAPWMAGVNDGGQTDAWGKKIYGLPNIGADQGAGLPMIMNRIMAIGKHIRV